jgi:type II secretory pathway pseudopilin PulG
MVVMAVVFLISAIAIPRLLRARNRANEAAAVASMKVIRSAEMVYQSTYPDKGFANTLVNLGSNGSTCETTSATNACLIESALAGGLKSGYMFDLLGDGRTPDMTYTLKATPQSSNDGDCMFLTDQSGAIQSMPAMAPPHGLQGGGGSQGSQCTESSY